MPRQSAKFSGHNRIVWITARISAADGTHIQSARTIQTITLTVPAAAKEQLKAAFGFSAPMSLPMQRKWHDGVGVQGQHKPQGVREQHYIRRPLDLLRKWHVKIEAWILEQAEIRFVPVQAGLRVVKSHK